jgi:undecaprenyl-diphosphatase
MGIAQAVAIFPGISRSGSTVLAGLWRRITPTTAAEFSFLMSIPAILGAAVLLGLGGARLPSIRLFNRADLRGVDRTRDCG